MPVPSTRRGLLLLGTGRCPPPAAPKMIIFEGDEDLAIRRLIEELAQSLPQPVTGKSVLIRTDRTLVGDPVVQPRRARRIQDLGMQGGRRILHEAHDRNRAAEQLDPV